MEETRTQRPYTLVDAAARIFAVEQVTVQEAEQVLLPFRERNAVAVVPSELARGAIVDLERAGIDGDRISFVRLQRARGDTTPSSSLAALWSTFRRSRASPAWERSLQAEPGALALIGAHLDDDRDAVRVCALLQAHDVWVLAHDGSVLHGPSDAGVDG